VGDLISRKALIEAINENVYPIDYNISKIGHSVSCGMTAKGIKQLINEQPTAYDVENVVSKLRELQSRYGKEDFAIRGVLEKAIEIVEFEKTVRESPLCTFTELVFKKED